jgi:ABC-2 type transport system permease protein
MKPYVHELLRYGSILTVSLVLVVISVLTAVIFYGRVFELYPLGMILIVSLVTLLPIVLFAMGSGKVISRAGRQFVYAWMLVPFVLRALTLPDAFGLLNGSLFSERPMALGVLDPEFSLPLESVIVQCAVFVTGLVLALASFRKTIHFK